jgi:hypothetical protein
MILNWFGLSSWVDLLTEFFYTKKWQYEQYQKATFIINCQILKKLTIFLDHLIAKYVHSFNLVDVVAKEVKMKANFLIFNFLFSLNIMIIIFT